MDTFVLKAGTPGPPRREPEALTPAHQVQAMPPRRPQRSPELDELTVASAQRGNSRARRALVERYQRPVLALVSRMLRGRGEAALVEDVAQETFLRVPSHDR